MNYNDPILASYATVRQLEILESLDAHEGDVSKVAKKLSISPSTIERSIRRLKTKAASFGHAPEHDMTKTVPLGFKVKGVSTLYNEDGQVRGQWVKSVADDQAQAEAMRAAYAAMADELPRLDAVKPPKVVVNDLLTLYTLTDSHVGMRAWAKETGADWDLGIAENTLVGCFEQMIQASPPASVGFINQLGDFLHYDSLLPMTPTSGHVVDADSRYSKMATTAIRILRRVVGMALEKHEKVVVLLAEGNHDMAGSVWLRVMFQALYENEPRIEVIDSELPYYTYQHGNTMLAFHHGHLKKNDQLPLLFATEFPKVWGNTQYRYCHTGHRHHVEEKEHSGMYVVQHATLAARDAYAARGGWQSNRLVYAITYHTAYGQVAKNTIVPEMLEPNT